jgi:hypothetical protein
MGVRVDEARRDHEARRVDHPCRLSGGQIADRRDALAAHAHVGRAFRRARAAHDTPVTNQ